MGCDLAGAVPNTCVQLQVGQEPHPTCTCTQVLLSAHLLGGKTKNLKPKNFFYPKAKKNTFTGEVFPSWGDSDVQDAAGM